MWKKDRDEKKEEEKKNPEMAPKPKEMTLLEEEYLKLVRENQEFSELKDKMLRTAADYENAKKRFNREKEEFLKFANERLIREFLPILDNLDRAMIHARQNQDSREAILSGIEIIRKHLFETLKSHGLERLEVLGKKFDPHQHEALGEIEDPAQPPETVLEEIEGGYLYQGRLLRPAKVRIAKLPESGRQAQEQEKDEDIT